MHNLAPGRVQVSRCGLQTTGAFDAFQCQPDPSLYTLSDAWGILRREKNLESDDQVHNLPARIPARFE